MPQVAPMRWRRAPHRPMQYYRALSAVTPQAAPLDTPIRHVPIFEAPARSYKIPLPQPLALDRARRLQIQPQHQVVLPRQAAPRVGARGLGYYAVLQALLAPLFAPVRPTYAPIMGSDRLRKKHGEPALAL